MSFLRILSSILLLNVSVMTLASTIKCRLNYASFETSHLKCLKKEAIVSSIRKNFQIAETLKKSCPKCHEPFPDATKFQYLFHQPLMVLEIDTKDFGGYWVFAAFKREAKLYRIWLYENDEGNFSFPDLVQHLLSLNPRHSPKTDLFLDPYYTLPTTPLYPLNFLSN